MTFDQEAKNRAIEAVLLKKLNLSDDIQAFREQEEKEANDYMKMYLDGKVKNDRKNKTAFTCAFVAAMGLMSAGTALPFIAIGTLGTVVPLAFKNYNLDELKEHAEAIQEFNAKEKAPEELLLSEEFREFKKENDESYINSLDKIESRNDKAKLVASLTFFPSLALAGATIAGFVAPPLMIASLGVLAASSSIALYQQFKRGKLDKEFNENFVNEMEKTVHKYESAFEYMDKKITENPELIPKQTAVDVKSVSKMAEPSPSQSHSFEKGETNKSQSEQEVERQETELYESLSKESANMPKNNTSKKHDEETKIKQKLK